jgi:hypothetical protein
MAQLNDIHDIYKTMTENRIILLYQGLFEPSMLKSVVAMTEKKLVDENIDESLRRKLFNVMVESLQNISKHQQPSTDKDRNPFLMINRDETSYNIITGNFIVNDKISTVSEKIDFINSLNKEELKEHYKNARLNSIISDVGGAGLGFIDMVRKSGNQLEYKFYAVDTVLSFFVLRSTINMN